MAWSPETMRLIKELTEQENLRFFGSKECNEYKIRFQGREYLLIGSKTTGSIATQEQFDNFETSFAYLHKDGVIRQFGMQIGTINDIEFL